MNDVWVVWLLALMCAAGWLWTFVRLQGVKAVRVDAVVTRLKQIADDVQVMFTDDCDCSECVARREAEASCDCDICEARRRRDG